MEGALPIKCSVRLLLIMTHHWGQYEKSVRCGTIDALNQGPYQSAAQDVAAWWCEESSPWVSVLEGWKRFWHEVIGEATASRLCHTDQIIIFFPNEGACGWWITEIALFYYYIWSVWYNHILQQEIKENVAFREVLLIGLSWLKRPDSCGWKPDEKESECRKKQTWLRGWNTFVESGQNEAGLSQWKVFMDDNTRVYFKNESWWVEERKRQMIINNRLHYIKYLQIFTKR